jgi:hypothetical protein
MIAAGVNAEALSSYMGHSTITVTLDRYGHLLPGNEREAAGLLDRCLAQADYSRSRLQYRPVAWDRSGGTRWSNRSSKPVRSGNPRLGRFDSCAAPLRRFRSTMLCSVGFAQRPSRPSRVRSRPRWCAIFRRDWRTGWRTGCVTIAPVSAPVDDELEARVAEAVAAQRELIAELVRQAVDRELVELVDQELELALERLAGRNGAQRATHEATGAPLSASE